MPSVLSDQSRGSVSDMGVLVSDGRARTGMSPSSSVRRIDRSGSTETCCLVEMVRV